MIRPFHRSLAVAHVISMALGAGVAPALIMNAPEFQYTSRGHGKGLLGKNYLRNRRSKYSPHQGAKEIARRASQIERGILATN